MKKNKKKELTVVKKRRRPFETWARRPEKYEDNFVKGADMNETVITKPSAEQFKTTINKFPPEELDAYFSRARPASFRARLLAYRQRAAYDFMCEHYELQIAKLLNRIKDLEDTKLKAAVSALVKP